jgi:hypothetical protein
VIVYGHHGYQLEIASFLRGFLGNVNELPAAPSHDAIVDLFVSFSEAYVAAIDARCPDRDDDVDLLRPWARTLHALARALTASADGDAPAVRQAIASCRVHAARVQSAGLPGSLAARTAEGFAHYSLYPEQYGAAATRFVETMRPRGVTCIGVRTVGVPLAHVVAAACERRGVPATVHTVRPRGHPFDRRLMLSERLRQRLRRTRATHFAIVDEGPGLSGSSFAATSDALLELGISSSRIVLFPSWPAPASALNSTRGQRTWERHVRCVSAIDAVFATDGHENLSGGAWRGRVFGSARRWPAVQPQHERLKYLSEVAGHAWISRFAGLGPYGRAKRERAERLAAAGFTPAPLLLSRGLLTRSWIEAVPLAPRGTSLRAIDRIAAYVACVRRTFPTGRAAQVDDLVEMLRTNVRESGASLRADVIDALAADARQFAEPEIAVDGRMLPHDWLRTSGNVLLKVDALDHHADDFLPGCRDCAWDIAGTMVEFDLDAPRVARLVDRYRWLSSDTTIERRLPFYRAAYLAYRIGYATLAAQTLGPASADGQRFASLTARYRRSLEGCAPPRRRDRRS